jgi:ABC-type nitrate/sulfonate/bicarbonate transport system substrate-binding protein
MVRRQAVAGGAFLSRRACIAGGAMLAMGGAARAQSPRRIIIGLSSGSMAAAAPRLADALGLFEKHGLSARLVILDSSSAAIAGLISGSVQFINSGVPELIIAQAHGQKVVAIANTYNGFATSMVLSKSVADRLGIAATAPASQRLKALDGLIIASTSATAIGTVVYNAQARAAGATMRLTYIAQSAMPAALQSGAIQGFGSSAPYWATPIAQGIGTLWFNGPAGDLPAQYTPGITSTFDTMRDFANANPDLIATVKAVFADLATSINERPAEVKAAMARLFPDLDNHSLDLLFGTESLGWRGGALTTEEMAHEIAIVKATITLPPAIDAIDPAALLVP